MRRFLAPKKAKILLAVVALAVAAASAVTTGSRPASAVGGGSAWPIDTYGLPRASDNVVLKWTEQLLDVIRTNPKATGPTVAARALGVANTAIYDAWAAYDGVAIPTRPGELPRQPPAERTAANKNKAISFAAYKILNDLFPDTAYHRKANFDAQMAALGYATDGSDVSTAASVGNAAAQAVIDFRHADGANQLGDDPNGTPGVPYSDTTGYQPVNSWDNIVDPQRWQPLCVPIVTSGTPCPDPTRIQKPLTPQWGRVTPFTDLDPATHYPPLFELPGPPDMSQDPTDIDTALKDTSNLSDAQKMKAEYWADGPKSEFPPGHMAVFAQALSRMRSDTLDQDVKLFFTLGNAVMDSSISAWAAKYQYDCVRPTTAIRERYKNQLVTSWLGQGNGYGKVLGQDWVPYQALDVVTPAFPEYVSGHSTFSAAGRTVLLAFFGTDAFNAKVTIKAGSSKIEPGVTPARDVVLSWKTLTAAADEAGWSRRYGGIHFQTGDEHGRALGKLIGYNAWTKAQSYFNGTATG